ncbi:Papilin [Labeo rohita]|uniref:Papilin n=1 Tax=Labeo rohita TaxID=84645 RepID=A0ABQ8L5G8_LABRO|nr:Papilin [Labeo rohita]
MESLQGGSGSSGHWRALRRKRKVEEERRSCHSFAAGEDHCHHHLLFASPARHDRCLTCLGNEHTEMAFVDGSCPHCEHMSMAALRFRLSCSRMVPLAPSWPGSSGSTSLAATLESAGSSCGEPCVSFGAPEEDRMSITASEEGLTPDEAEESAEQLPSMAAAQSEADSELAAMLLWAAKSIGLVVRKPTSPEPSQLDDWFLGSRRDSNQPRLAPVPFFLEVHEELTKMWKAPYSGVAVHLCLQNAATWRNRPCLPSKACKLLSSLAAKAYSAAGQAASVLHAMAILQVHQAQALKQLHAGWPNKGVMQELRTATDFALRATKMADADKVLFLDASVSQAGLFGDIVKDFAQQFSVVQKQTEAIKHILPWCESTKPPVAKPSSARRRGRPPGASTPAPPKESMAPQRGCQAGCGKGAQPTAQASNSTRTTRRWERLLCGGLQHLRPCPWPTHSQKEQFSLSLGHSPQIQFLSDALLPQTRTRVLNLQENQGWKMYAAPCSPTLWWDATPPTLSHLPPHGCPTIGASLPPLIPPGIAAQGWLSRTVRRLRCPTRKASTQTQMLLSCVQRIEPVPPAVMKLGFQVQGHLASPCQLGEEQALPCAEHLFSRDGAGFGQNDGTPHGRARTVSAQLSELIQTQHSGPSKDLSEAPGAYGSCSRGHAARLASYETASALAPWPDPEMGTVAHLHLRVLNRSFSAHGQMLFKMGREKHYFMHSAPGLVLLPPGWAGMLYATGKQPRAPGQDLDCLELLAVFLALRWFHLMLRGEHVLVRMDNMATVAYINRQGGLRSRRMLQLTRHLLLWSLKWLKSLGAVRALRIYVDRTWSFRRSEQLFVCFGGQQKGNAISKQRLSHWVVDAITLAYQCQGEPCPLGVRAQCYGLAHGASPADICRAAGWAAPKTFAPSRCGLNL